MHARVFCKYHRAQALPEYTAETCVDLFLKLCAHQDTVAGNHTAKQEEILEHLRTQPLPLWWQRLYEHLWRLAPGRVCDQEPSSLEEASAALCARQLAPDSYGPVIITPLQRSRNQLLYLLPHFLRHGLPTSLTPTEQLVMFVNKALGSALDLNLDPEALANTRRRATEKERHTAPHPPDASPASVTHGLSPEELATLLPEYAAQPLVTRYYRAWAWPHLFTFSQPIHSTAPHTALLDRWSVDAPIQQLDWQASLVRSPRIVPGITTLQQEYEVEEGREDPSTPALFLYLDSSRSMINPRKHNALLVVAGTVLMLSALKSRWKVQVINWAEHTVSTALTEDEGTLFNALLLEPRGAPRLPLEHWQNTSKKTRPNALHVILSDLGGMQSLQQLSAAKHRVLDEWAAQTRVFCVLDTPLNAAQRRASVHHLQKTLPHWHFKTLNHLEALAQWF